MHVFSGCLSENECKYLNERDHKFYTVCQSMGYQVKKFRTLDPHPPTV